MLVTEETPIEHQELQAYKSTGTATLQVPRARVHRPQHLDDSCTYSPVEIRITSATPLPDMMEAGSEEKAVVMVWLQRSHPQSKEGSQAKHKFTFSFDVAGEAPEVVTEPEVILKSEGETTALQL